MPPLVPIAIAWLLGLIAAHHWLVPAGIAPASLALLCLLPVAAFVLWRKTLSVRLAAVCALLFLLATLRYQAALPDLADPEFVAHYNGSGWMVLEGVIDGYPDVRDTATNLRLRAEWLEIEDQRLPVRGAVRVRAPRYPEYGYGDRLRVLGYLETAPEFETFSYKDYLARLGIHAYVAFPRGIERIESGQGNPFWALLYRVKDRAGEAISRLVPEPATALLHGILLGTRAGIPEAQYEAYNVTGTSHVLVISGANITIVATITATLFARVLGRRRAYWFTMAGIAVYVLLVGADAVVVRAGIMAGLFVSALYLGRRAAATVALLASALFLTLINPLMLWDLGFQLSFAATLGLILLVGPFESLLQRGFGRLLSAEGARQAARLLRDVLIVTLAAQIMTLPLLAYHFGRLSLVAPLANLLILWAQPPIMVGGGLVTLVGMVPLLEPLARVLAWVPWLFLAYTDAVVRWLATWPLASLELGRVGPGWLVVAYAAILGALWLVSRPRAALQQIRGALAIGKVNKVLLGALLVTITLAGIALCQLPDGKLHVAFLDVGQGDAILITTPSGRQVLVDGGPSPAALASALGRQMPFWDRSIDLVILTHPDADHITGLPEVLDRYRVGGWLENGRAEEDAVYKLCQHMVQEQAVQHHVARDGDRLDLGEGIILQVLHPPARLMQGTGSDSNNNSLVLRLDWEEAGFLLTGDLEAEGEDLLLKAGQPLAAGVLKVGHHGSGGSSTAGFLDAVAPHLAVVSVGAGNTFGHPAPEVLERLSAQGNVTVLRTDEVGTVELVTNGQQIWVHTER